MAVQQAMEKDTALPEAMGKARSPMADAWRDLLKNRAAVAGGIIIIIFITLGILAGVLAPYGYADNHFQDAYAKPGGEFLAGTDAMGRDILSRTLYGTRVSLTVGIVGATVSLIIGLIYGLVSGFFGGRVDNLMMRLVDFMYGLPNIILVILMQVYFKAVSRRQAVGLAGALVDLDNAMGGLLFIFIALGAFNWIGMARIARGQVLSLKEKEFVEAARSIGSGNQRIILRHILPNILGPCIVAETLAIPGYIFFEAFLSFIGLGVNPPTPSWGAMINQGYQGLRSNPHLVIAPSIALTLTVLSFNFFGDGLRDAFDPRVRGVIGPKVSRRTRLAGALTRRRVVVGLATVLVAVIGIFALLSGRGVGGNAPATAVPTEAPATYVTEFGHEVNVPQTPYDPPKTGVVTSQSPIPSIFYVPGGKAMIGIIGRDTKVEVLGETTTGAGDLFYLIKGFGTEGWMDAADITIEEP